MTIKILLIDDHLLLLEGLKAVLENEPSIHVVGTIADPSQLLEELLQLRPDVILMDIRIKSHNGLTLTKSITQQFPHIKVIILSGYDDDAYVQVKPKCWS